MSDDGTVITATRRQAELIERALRYTVGEEFGGVGVESFSDRERALMLAMSDRIHVGLREREIAL